MARRVLLTLIKVFCSIVFVCYVVGMSLWAVILAGAAGVLDASHRYGDKFFLSGRHSSLISPVHADRMFLLVRF